MAKTNGSRNFSDLLGAIQILARRPMSQVSSSFPSYYDEWDDSTNAAEYYDIDDHNDVDNDGYYDEYDELEDHGEWIDMSGIFEEATFEEPELACMLDVNEEAWPNADLAIRATYEGALIDGLPADKVKAGDEREIKQMKDLHLYSWAKETDIPPNKSSLLAGSTRRIKMSEVRSRCVLEDFATTVKEDVSR